MMGLIELFSDVTLGTMFKVVIAFIGGVSSISAISVNVFKWIEKYRKIRNESDHKDIIINKTIKDVEVLKTDMSNMAIKLDDVLSMIKLEQEKRMKRERAKFKKDIKEIYQKCNVTKTVSHMDLNTLEDLITEYEEAGGKNSFVHTVVQKEMYTWEEVDD